MSRSVKSWTVLALLLLAGAVYCFYWLYGHGAFGTSPIEIPVHLDEGSRLSTSFYVSEKGQHYIELQYPKVATYDIDRELDAIAGKATLTSHGGFIARANLPVGHRGFYSMVLFTLSMEPHREYHLSLDVARLPSALKQARPTIKVWVDPHYNLIFPQIELLGVLLVVLALFCLVPGIRLKAGHLKFPFLILLATSLAITGLGYAGLMLIRPSSFAGWRWSMVQVCFLFVVLGPVAFILSLVSWFAASVIGYFRSYRAGSSP